MFEASGELLLILVVALIVVGPSKLPELIRSFGKGLAEFRRMTSDVKATLEREIERADELKRIGEIKEELFDEADKAKQVLTGVAQDVSGQVNEVGGQLTEVAREAGAVRPEPLDETSTVAADETASAPDQAAGVLPASSQEHATVEDVAREPAASGVQSGADAPGEHAATSASTPPAASQDTGKAPGAKPAPSEEKSHA